MSVSIGWQHLEDAIINSQQADIKCSTTQIKHKNILPAFLFVESICHGCCSSARMNTKYM